MFRGSRKKISQGKIIGWFQGRMEIGARALGIDQFLLVLSLAI